MMSSPSPARRSLVWAVLGGLVLLAGVLAIIITSLVPRTTPGPEPEPTTTTAAPSPGPTSSSGAMVDASVTERGWRPEPITTDREVYIAAALEAASTFDTTLSTREEWLDYLDTWFTPDTRFTSQADQLAAMESSQVELRQGVVLPSEMWDSLAGETGRVVAEATSEPVYVPVSDDASGDMSIGTADVTLQFTRSDGQGGEVSYEEFVRVSVQVLCGAGSVPTPGSAQQAGDCKVVRYFTEPLEP